MKKKENPLSEELKLAKNLIKNMKKVIREKTKILNKAEKSESEIEELKSFFDGK